MKKVFENKKKITLIVLIALIMVALVHIVWLLANQIKTQPAGHLIERRSGHHAVLLSDGRIYIVGGDKHAITAEIYDPKTKKSKKVANLPELLYRQEYSVTALNNGKVLIAGGRHHVVASYIPYSKTAYIYDPNKNIYEPPISMKDYHMEHKAVLLKDGSVILTGGNASSIIDLYNSKLNKFISFGKYCTPLEFKKVKYVTINRQGLILLANDIILVAGGSGCGDVNDDYSSQAKVIDTKLKKIYPVGSLNINRGYPEVTLLKNGRALVSGGTNNPQLWVKELEIYDPQKKVFINAGKMDERSGYTATLLPTGKVLFVGGSTGVAQVSRGLTSMYVYDPKDYSYKFLGNLRKIRAGHTATVLQDGSIVFVGSAWDKSVEIYKPTGRE